MAMTREKDEIDILLLYVSTNAETILYANRHLGVSIADGICLAVRKAAKLEKLRRAANYEPQTDQP
jgi:hypothetical protein